MTFCTACGAKIDGARFCTSCGAPQSAAAPQSASPASLDPQPAYPTDPQPAYVAEPQPASVAEPGQGYATEPEREPASGGRGRKALVVVGSGVLALAVGLGIGVAVDRLTDGATSAGERDATDTTDAAGGPGNGRDRPDGDDPDGDDPDGDDKALVTPSASPTSSPDGPLAGSTPSPAPTVTEPAPQSTRRPVARLKDNLYCRNLAPEGYTYAEAVQYWELNGRPDRLDADVDGIPCETVYPEDDVRAVWGSALDTARTDVDRLAPGLTCTDLVQFQVAYEAVVSYWTLRQGADPAWDADGDGRPCDAEYPSGVLPGGP